MPLWHHRERGLNGQTPRADGPVHERMVCISRGAAQPFPRSAGGWGAQAQEWKELGEGRLWLPQQPFERQKGDRVARAVELDVCLVKLKGRRGWAE